MPDKLSEEDRKLAHAAADLQQNAAYSHLMRRLREDVISEVEAAASLTAEAREVAVFKLSALTSLMIQIKTYADLTLKKDR